MESGSLQAVAESRPSPGLDRQPPQRHPFPIRAVATVPVPDEPATVVVAGARRQDRRAVLAALAGADTSIPAVPPASFLVVRYGSRPAAAAFLPGSRAPRPYRCDDTGPAARPPRRVEAAMPEPFLRYVEFVDAPDTGVLGVPGNHVLLDVVERAGALLYLLPADQSPAPVDLDLLTEVAHRETAVFLAVTPPASGPGTAGDALDPARSGLLADVPTLARAPWFAVDPGVADPVGLRRVLAEWANLRALVRTEPEPVDHRSIRVAAGAYESDWADRLARRVRESDRWAWERLAADLADLHRRCVRRLTHPARCSGLPETLDREVHALSLRTMAGGDSAIAWILDTTTAQVFGTPDNGVRRRVAAAVRDLLDEDPAARDLDRVLLVTTTGGVGTVPGAAAVAALSAWPGPQARPSLLPPVGVGLSGGCYLHWHKPANADPQRARDWLARVVRAVELELGAELSRRFEIVRRALSYVLAEAVDHGILLA